MERSDISLPRLMCPQSLELQNNTAQCHALSPRNWEDTPNRSKTAAAGSLLDSLCLSMTTWPLAETGVSSSSVICSCPSTAPHFVACLKLRQSTLAKHISQNMSVEAAAALCTGGRWVEESSLSKKGTQLGKEKRESTDGTCWAIWRWFLFVSLNSLHLVCFGIYASKEYRISSEKLATTKRCLCSLVNPTCQPALSKCWSKAQWVLRNCTAEWEYPTQDGKHGQWPWSLLPHLRRTAGACLHFSFMKTKPWGDVEEGGHDTCPDSITACLGHGCDAHQVLGGCAAM